MVERADNVNKNMLGYNILENLTYITKPTAYKSCKRRLAINLLDT